MTSQSPRTPNGPYSANTNDCCICLDPMLQRGEILISASCGHKFHLDCLRLAIQRGNTTCPLCRDDLAALAAQLRLTSTPNTSPSSFPSNMYMPFPFSLPSNQAPSPIQVPESIPDEEIPAARSSAPSEERPPTTATSTTPTVGLMVTLEEDAVPPSVSKEVVAMVSLRGAPSVNNATRPSLDIVMVLDRSGSMAGAKIELLRDSVSFIVDQLGDQDRLSLVTFNHRARVVGGLRCMTAANKRFYHDLLGGGSASSGGYRRRGDFEADGNTEIREGLHLGQEIITRRRHVNPVTAILLLTDGQDGHLKADNVSTVRDWSFFETHHCAFHLFGFGADHDTRLLSAMAHLTNGTFTFVENPHSLGESFGHCLGGLLSQVAGDLKITVRVLGEHRIASILSPGAQTSHQSASWTLPSLMSNQQKDFLWRVAVPALPSDAPSFRVEVRYRKTGHGEAGSSLRQREMDFNIPRRTDPPPAINREVVVQSLRLLVAESLKRVTEMISSGRRSDALETVALCRRSLERDPTLRQHPLLVQLVIDLDECDFRLRNRGESQASVNAFCTSVQRQHMSQQPGANHYTGSPCHQTSEGCTLAANPYSNSSQQTCQQAYSSSRK